MFCPNCGQENAPGARACETCGADLTRVTVAQPDSQTAKQAVSVDRPAFIYGGFWRRLVAYFIDYLVLIPVVALFSIPLIISIYDGTAGENPTDVLLLLLTLYLVRPLYFTILEASAKQATLGKMMVRLIVTDADGNRISFGRAAGRNYARIISEYFFYVGYIIIAFNKKKQGLHDLLASTIIIKK